MATESLLVRLNMDATRYNAQARTAAANTGAIGASARTTTAQTGKLKQGLSGLGATAQAAVGVAAAGAVVKFGKDSVQAFLGFDDAMNQSLAIMGDVDETMRKDMAEAAREVGKTTRIGAEEAAESYFFLASAGLDAAQSIEAMPAVAQFAQAGMFDMAKATDLATDAQSALGLATDDPAHNLRNLTRVTDVFVKANQTANATVEEFATSMTQKAGGALRSLGKDLEEGVAVLAVFADQGIKGERAGTILRATLDGLTANARNNADAFEELNVQVFDADDNMRNMADITADLEEALGPMTVKQREAALAQLGFNKRSREGILALLGNSEAVRENEQAYRDAGGAAQEVADNQLESYQGQLELLQGAAEDLQISLGEMITPLLIERADAWLNTIDAVRGIFEALGEIELPPILQGGADFGGGIWDFLTRGAIPGPVGGLIDFLIDLGDESDEAAAAASELTDAELAARDAFAEAGGAASGAGDATGDYADDADDAGDSAEEAADKVRDLTLAFLEAANPIFAAQGALDRYEQAQANLEETRADSESTARDIAAAELDVAHAALEAEAALVELGDGSITEGISAIATALGISDEEARDLLETLGILDGTEVTSVVNTDFVTRGTPPPSSNAPTGRRRVSGRHSGGPGRAGEPYLIKPDEEIFVPSGNGEFLLNEQVISALQGANTTTTNNNSRNLEVTYVNPRLADDPVESIRNAFALDSMASL